MTDSEILRRLKTASENKDFSAWNEWQEGNKRDRKYLDVHQKIHGPNLVEAGLYNAYLREADLSWANLNHADLRGANLSGADLSMASLQDAVLVKANLKGAKLKRAYFRRADLSGADLRETDLGEAILNDCDLSEANIYRADLRHTRGIEPSQIKSAVSWERAFYGIGILALLDLPKDHNERLQSELQHRALEEQVSNSQLGDSAPSRNWRRKFVFDKHFFDGFSDLMKVYFDIFQCGVITVTFRIFEQDYHVLRIMKWDDALITFVYYDESKSLELSQRVREMTGEIIAWPALTVPYGAIEAVEFNPGKAGNEQEIRFRG